MAKRQYRLSQGFGEFSRARSQKIIEKEIPGMRKGIPTGETYNWYGAPHGR